MVGWALLPVCAHRQRVPNLHCAIQLHEFICVTLQQLSIVLLVFGTLPPVAQADEANKIAAAAMYVRLELERLDVDRDRRLSLQEFLQHRGEQPVLERDFKLYDLDANGFLARSEFASVSGLTLPLLRGKMSGIQTSIALLQFVTLTRLNKSVYPRNLA